MKVPAVSVVSAISVARALCTGLVKSVSMRGHNEGPVQLVGGGGRLGLRERLRTIRHFHST